MKEKQAGLGSAAVSRQLGEDCRCELDGIWRREELFGGIYEFCTGV